MIVGLLYTDNIGEEIIHKCKNSNEDYELGSALQDIVTDWSYAELKIAVEKKTAKNLRDEKCTGSDHASMMLTRSCHHMTEKGKENSS